MNVISMGKRSLYVIPIFLFATIIFAADYGIKKINKDNQSNASIKNEGSSNKENFDKMMDVLTHQRCVNCHPSNNVPKQGDDQHPHYFGVARGEENMGFEALNCETCHQTENNDFSGVPGAPHWSLAPHTMRWDGLSRTEIAASMLDRKRNGFKSPQQIMEHLTEDPLVLWAWEPGIDAAGNPRAIPPVPKAEYIKIVKEWFEAGAVIPEQ